MQKIKFAYNEPMIDEIINEGPNLEFDEAVKLIEQTYPTAIDIEIIETIEIE